MTELTKLAVKTKEDKRFFNELITEWEKKVRLEGHTRRKTLQEHDSKDLKQEILINIFEKFKEYNPERASFETWAFNRSKSVTRSWIRKEVRRRHPILRKGYRKTKTIEATIQFITNDFQIPEPRNPEVYEAGFLIEDLQSAINEMAIDKSNREPTLQTLDLLSEEKTTKQIAKILRVSIPKAYGNIKRIRKAYGLIVEAYEEAEV